MAGLKQQIPTFSISTSQMSGTKQWNLNSLVVMLTWLQFLLLNCQAQLSMSPCRCYCSTESSNLTWSVNWMCIHIGWHCNTFRFSGQVSYKICHFLLQYIKYGFKDLFPYLVFLIQLLLLRIPKLPVTSSLPPPPFCLQTAPLMLMRTSMCVQNSCFQS